eukprot:1560014-Lingulodinium_polyedra.AAC.1
MAGPSTSTTCWKQLSPSSGHASLPRTVPTKGYCRSSTTALPMIRELLLPTSPTLDLTRTTGSRWSSTAPPRP